MACIEEEMEDNDVDEVLEIIQIDLKIRKAVKICRFGRIFGRTHAIQAKRCNCRVTEKSFDLILLPDLQNCMQEICRNRRPGSLLNVRIRK